MPKWLPSVKLKTDLKDSMQFIPRKLTNAYNSKCEYCERKQNKTNQSIVTPGILYI